MFATPVAHWFGRRGIHFSWVVMGIAFLTMLTSSAALGLPGAFLLPLSREFGWSTDEISGAIALRFALYGLIGPFAAVLMERYGLRRIICRALLLIATGLEHRRDLRRDRAALRAVRLDRPVRRGADGALRAAPHHLQRAAADRHRHGARH